MLFDLQDFILFFSNDTFFQLESALFAKIPSIADLSYEDPIVRESLTKFLYETEASNHVVYRKLHPMCMLSFVEPGFRTMFLTNLLAHVDLSNENNQFLLSFMEHQGSLRLKMREFLQQQGAIFPMAYRAWHYMNEDLWSFLMAGFVPDFVDGPFWDHCHYDASDEIVSCWSMFLLTLN